MMSFKKKMAGLLCLAASQVYAQTTINGFSMPESIVSDGKRFFVSNQGQDVFAKDGDGFISEVSADGKLVTLKWAPVNELLHAPKGMVVMDDILYVADLERVLGFNVNTRQMVFELTVPRATLLNDICSLEDGFIAVTETVSGNIYKINIRKKDYKIIGNLPAANGISYNKKTRQLLVATNGKNFGQGSIYLQTSDGNFEALPGIANGFFDGVEWMDDQYLLISDWVTFPTAGYGKLWIYDLERQEANFVFTGESIADIHFDRNTRKIWMPQMFGNKVIITDLQALSRETPNLFNKLYNYGIIDAFIGGLYKGTLPVKKLKLKGDFGLGAPDMLDGEMTLLDGKVYQTHADGTTNVLNDEHQASFASTTFFKADTTFYVNGMADQKRLLELISQALANPNGMYAIKITGVFNYIKTRAFPPVSAAPFPPLATLLHKQQFFEIINTKGTLIGFHLPEYLNGINASGFHFHFLSSDKKQGGHLLDLKGAQFKIEIATLKGMELETPDDKPFREFRFKQEDNESLRKVEQGK